MRGKLEKSPTEGRSVRLTTALFLGATLGLLGCRGDPGESKPAVRPVKTVVLGSPGTGVLRSFPGEIEPSKRVDLAFQVSGPLKLLPAREGQEFQAGDVLAEIDPRDFQTRLTAADGRLGQAHAELEAMKLGAREEEKKRLDAQVASAQSELQRAEGEFNRAKPLIEKRVISQTEYDGYRTAYETAKASLEQAVRQREQATVARPEDIAAKESEIKQLEAGRKEAEDALADAKLLAPYDGIAAAVFVDQFQNVVAKQPVVRFVNLDEVEVVVNVPEKSMYGDPDSITRLVARLPALPGQTFNLGEKAGEVRWDADPETQTYRVTLLMEVPPGVRVLPGSSAIVDVEVKPTDAKGQHFMVPVAAVFNPGGEQSFVWLIDSEMTARRRPVSVAAMAEEHIEVTAGLKAGDRIAVAGVHELEEGMKVRLLDGEGEGR